VVSPAQRLSSASAFLFRISTPPTTNFAASEFNNPLISARGPVQSVVEVEVMAVEWQPVALQVVKFPFATNV